MNRFPVYKYACSLIAIASILLACTHKPEVLPPDYVISPPGNGGTPNVKDSVCYENEIQPLLTSNCAQSGCHDDTTRSAGVVLVNYEKLKATVSGNLLLQSMQDTGSLGMPPAPMAKLSSAQMQSIQKWLNEGMKKNIDCPTVCDTVNITFAGTIYPIIQNSCVGCHNGPNSSGSTDLSTYAAIKVQVDNGMLNCTINRLSGCHPMPPSGPLLPQCNLDQIRKWIEAGAPSN